MRGGFDLQAFLVDLLLTLPVILIALPVHEVAHGYVAKKLGDPTADSLGRLSLNPLKHFDILGFICMLLFGFGWAKPVPINTRYFKKPRRDMALSALAGPVSNILLALLFAALLKLAYVILGFVTITTVTAYNAWTLVLRFLWIGVSINVGFAIFNLLPIPPLDGSRLLNYFLPPKAAYWMIRHEQIIQLVLFAALFIGVLDYPIAFLRSHALRLISLLFGL